MASRSNTSSPSVITPSGSYSSPHPRADSSPNGSTSSIHNSNSVGTDLHEKGVDVSALSAPDDATTRNGKRKVDQRRSIENG